MTPISARGAPEDPEDADASGEGASRAVGSASGWSAGAGDDAAPRQEAVDDELAAAADEPDEEPDDEPVDEDVVDDVEEDADSEEPPVEADEDSFDDEPVAVEPLPPDPDEREPVL